MASLRTTPLRRCLPGLLGLAWAAFLLAAGSGCHKQKEAPVEEDLDLTVVPYEAAPKLAEEYQPMADYLASRVGAKYGRFILVTDYAGVVAALESKQVDVAYLSCFPYALASKRMKLEPLAMPVINKSLTYCGVIFVRADSPIKTIDDLRGKRFAFGDQTSTSGYLLPRAMFESKGIYDTLKGNNVGDATAVVKAVENGAADAGAAYNDVLQVVYKNEPQKIKGMRIIGRTEEIPNGIYVARPGLAPEMVEKLRKAFMDMNTDQIGHAAMLAAPNEKMVPVDDRLFDPVREKARILNLDLRQLDRKQ